MCFRTAGCTSVRIKIDFLCLSNSFHFACKIANILCAADAKLQSVLGPGDQGSTYGGNPVCCAGALSVIERLTDSFLASIKRRSGYIMSAFYGAPGIESVSGMGLMIGIKTTAPAGAVVKACMEKGVLCLTAKDKVRLLPALNISMEVLLLQVQYTLKDLWRIFTLILMFSPTRTLQYIFL